MLEINISLKKFCLCFSTAAEKRARPKQSGKAAKSKRQTRAKRPEKKNTKVRVSLESSRDSSVEGRRKTKRRKISTSSSSRCSTPEPKRSCTAIKIRGRASLDSKTRDPKLNSRLAKCEKLLNELSSAEEAEYFMELVDVDKVEYKHQAALACTMLTEYIKVLLPTESKFLPF